VHLCPWGIDNGSLVVESETEAKGGHDGTQRSRHEEHQKAQEGQVGQEEVAANYSLRSSSARRPGRAAALLSAGASGYTPEAPRLLPRELGGFFSSLRRPALLTLRMSRVYAFSDALLTRPGGRRSPGTRAPVNGGALLG